MELREFQNTIRKIYYEKDSQRGKDGTFRWFIEEVGELAKAIRKGQSKEIEEEFADVLAWLVSLASLYNIDIEEAAKKYQSGCPKCKLIPCYCGR